MDSPAKTEADTAWEMFHESLRRLDRICKRDGVTLKLKVPILGAVKNKAKGLQSSGPPTLPELAPHCNLCGPGHYHTPRGEFCSTPSGDNRCRVCGKEDCPRDHGP